MRPLCLLRGATVARVRVVAVSLALVAGLSACGGTSSTSPSSASSGGTTTVPGATTGSGTSTTPLPGAGKPEVTIGDKNFTEQFLLGEMYTLALQAQGYTVQLNQNIGPTAVTLQALKTGALDMYPEYLDTFNTAIAGYHHGFRNEPDAYAAGQRYASAHGLVLLNATPFSDTSELAVTDGYASGYHLSTLYDLARIDNDITIGGPPEFQTTTPGLTDAQRVYSFTTRTFKPLAVGDQYTALNANEIQVADVNSTDGELATGDYTLLTDPENVFGWGNAVPVVSEKTLDTEGPTFVQTINRVNALLSTAVMRQLNEAVDVAGEDVSTVAKTFLETHGVIPPSS